MKAIEFLALLRAYGIKVTLSGGSLIVNAPKGALTPKVIESIKAHREELITFFKRQEQEAKAYEILRDRGWLVISSKALNENVVWTRDKKVAIPEKWNNLNSYTTDELITLLKQKEG